MSEDKHIQKSISSRQENITINLREQRESKEVLKSHPITIVLPTGSKCNLKCVFCTDRSPMSPYSYRNLTFEEFLRYTEPLQSGKSVGLYGWGEPLVNRDYRKIFEHIVKNFSGIEIYVTTNGVLIDQNWANTFINYEWTRLTISVNASTRHTYQKIMKADTFEKVISNVQRLITLRDKLRKVGPTVTLSFVSMVQNIEELPAFVDLAADLRVDYVLVQDFKILEEGQEGYSLVNCPGLAEKFYEEAKIQSEERRIPLSTFQPISYFDNHEPMDCFEPWESFRIAENGDVFPCCYSNYVMGNILQQSVEEIWNGAEYRYYRRNVNSNEPPLECRLCTKKDVNLQFVSHQWRRT